MVVWDLKADQLIEMLDNHCNWVDMALVALLLILQAVPALSPLTLVLSLLLDPMLKGQVDMEENHHLVLTLNLQVGLVTNLLPVQNPNRLEAMEAIRLEVTAATQQEGTAATPQEVTAATLQKVTAATLQEVTAATLQELIATSLLSLVNLFPARILKLHKAMVVILQEVTVVNLLPDLTPNRRAATVVTLQEVKKISLLWPTVHNLQDKLLRGIIKVRLLVALAARLPKPSRQVASLQVANLQVVMAVNRLVATVANLEVEATVSQHTPRKSSTIKSLTARTTVTKIRQDSTHNLKAKVLATVNSKLEAALDPVVMASVSLRPSMLHKETANVKIAAHSKAVNSLLEAMALPVVVGPVLAQVVALVATGQVGLVDLAPVVLVDTERVPLAPVGPVDTEPVLLGPVGQVDTGQVLLAPVGSVLVATAVVILDQGDLLNQLLKAHLNWLARACRRLVNSQQDVALVGRATLL